MKIGVNSKIIFIIFLGGIGIPCVLLGVLAYRGVRNDLALLEKERRIECQRAVDIIAAEMDKALVCEFNDFKDAVHAESSAFPEPRTEVVKTVMEKHPLIEGVFLIKNEKVEWLSPLLYTREKNNVYLMEYGDQNFASAFQKARQQEFESRNYAQAIRLYKRAMNASKDRRLHAVALNAIARNQKKLWRMNDAHHSYQTLINQYNDIPLSAGGPAGLSARYENAMLYVSQKDTLFAMGELLDLYSRLLNGGWAISILYS